MVLDVTDRSMEAALIASASPNVEFMPFVKPSYMAEFLAGGSALLSTSASRFEGFPNIFLQAGAVGVPIVSLEADPDGIFSKRQCGLCSVGNVDSCIAMLRSVHDDPIVAAGLVSRMRRYVEIEHEAAAIFAAYNHLLSGTLETVKP